MFANAHDHIKEFLNPCTLKPSDLPTTPTAYTYALVDTNNQTYELRSTKTIPRVLRAFQRWQAGDRSGLPRKMQEVLEHPSAPQLYLMPDRDKTILHRLRAVLSELNS